jgi:uncharacterized protein (DUF1501 family)
MTNHDHVGCGTAAHFNRRTLLKACGLSGLAWLTPLSQILAAAEEKSGKQRKPKSVILLWMEGGPSQLETFDPHPDSSIASGSTAIKSRAGYFLGSGLPQVADIADEISIVRSVTSKEGDHERAIYNIKTGFRPVPTIVHPSLGSVICHQTESEDGIAIEIPRHVSILGSGTPARGGYLGDAYDAFKIGDPKDPIPDIRSPVAASRFDQRRESLDFLEKQYAQRRARGATSSEAESDGGNGLRSEPSAPNVATTAAAVKMMSSEQLKAFEIKDVPQSTKDEFGDTSFGRGCIAAMNLIQNGIRCVEVNFGGWDSHVRNHEIHAGNLQVVDPAFAALIRHLKERELLEDTIVVCGGEFGRTPSMNPLGGRDHWPHGFSIALAGGRLRKGITVGETSATPKLDPKNPLGDVREAVGVEDIHATILHALGIDFMQELDTPIGRPMKLSDGKVIPQLIG